MSLYFKSVNVESKLNQLSIFESIHFTFGKRPKLLDLINLVF